MIDHEQRLNKMKQIKEEEIDFSFGWGDMVHINKVEAQIKKLRDIGATHIKFEYGTHYDDEYMSTQAIKRRFETNEELKLRIEREELEKEIKKDMAKRKIEELKKTYNL